MPDDEAAGRVRQGTRTLNLNRRNRLYWTTTSTITEMVPNASSRSGSTPTTRSGATSWNRPRPEPAWSNRGTPRTASSRRPISPVNKLFGGVPSFERELVEGMNASLARIKAAAENT